MRLLLISLTLIFVASINSVSAQVTKGFASTYPLAYEGTKTASGEIYNSKEYTARHATLPFNTLVKVTNLKNNKSITVRINDRFNYKNSRVIDISKAASRRINLFGDINPQVSIEVIGMADALMLASTPAEQEPETNVVAQTNTAPKKDTETVEESETVTAKVEEPKDKKITTPKLLPSVKASLPSISLKDVSDIATLSLKYITISLFK